MRVVYDYQAFSIQTYGGVSRYISELAAAMSRTGTVEATILAFAHINCHLESVKGVPGLVTGKRVPAIPGTWRIRSTFNRVATRRWLGRMRPDIIHESYYAHRPMAPAYIPMVVTVHDMIHEKYPEYFGGNDHTAVFKAASVERASHVICVSEATKRDVVELYNLDPKKISVVHHGFALRSEGNDLPRRLVEKPYILFVGKRSGYKNFDALLQAYARSPRLMSQYQLVCFGGGSFDAVERAIVSKVSRAGETLVRHIEGDDRVVANLYAHAAAFVYPSKYEGFGIPLLEAMSLQCPVICADTSVFREVTGTAAEFFDPEETDSITDAMERVLGDTERRRILQSEGRQRIAGFSWERCVAETIDVYRTIA